MRAGAAYTIHQSLTAEAAAVLKLALALARRRGHAQVTPLHVAFALLTGPATSSAQPLAAFSSSSSSPSPAARYGLLKRACLRSHPGPAPPGSAAPPPHGHGPLHCRALELCFNVALNRLHSPAPSSTAAPLPLPFTSSSSSLIQPCPTLSNALVAALRRAQANQRRGCVEFPQPPPPPPANAPPPPPPPPPPQPLVAIKVELDQLAMSILDDPSVSRVMHEAGFSSAAVKSSLEEECALMPPPPPHSSSSTPPPPILRPHFFNDDPSIGNGVRLWPAAQFLAAPGPRGSCSAIDDDVRAVMEVMLRDPEGRRSNAVVVGDSVSMAEAVAGELLRRLERGDVPEELAGAHILRLQLSYVHVRLMSRGDVSARAAELRHSVDAVQLQLRRRGGGGLVVYVGDLRWALEEDDGGHAAVSSYSPVDHMVAEVGRLLDELRGSRARAWLLATASYQTYMRWQKQRSRRPLDSAWALQAVVVPTGSGTGLSLNSLHSSALPSASATTAPPVMMTAQQFGQNPFTMVGDATAFAARDEQDEMQPVLCNECTKNYESEASLVKAEDDVEGPRRSLPRWLVLDRPPADQTPHEKYLMELKSKWSRLCRKLHLCSDPCSPPCPWWSGSCFPQSITNSKPRLAGFLGLEGLVEQRKSRTGRWSPPMGPGCHGVGTTTLALSSSHPLSDSATSGSRTTDEVEQRLRRNIPWQPAAAVAEIAKAVVASNGGKGVWLYVKGSDHAAAKRAVTVIAETRCGSADRVVCADASRFSCAEELCSDVVCRAVEMGGGKTTMLVVVVDGVGNAPCDVVECLVAASKSGFLKDRRSGQLLDLSGCIVILAESKLPGAVSGQISLRLWAEDEASSGDGLKRTTTESPQGQQCKRARHDAGLGSLDLNLCAEDGTDEDDDEAVPSDITHEGDSSDGSSEHGQPHGLLEALAARVVTLDKEGGGGGRNATAYIRTRLARAIGQGGTGTRVEETAVEALAAASGQFLEEEIESWTVEVLEPAVAVATVKNGGEGKVIVLGLGAGGGGGRETAGFMGSVLPCRVQVD